MAFGSTLAEESARDEEFWRERARGGADDDERSTFVVELEPEPPSSERFAGTATCLLGQLDGGAGECPAWLVGMWVDPAVRRQGAARALLLAVANWARERGADVLNLHVTEINSPAIALYES